MPEKRKDSKGRVLKDGESQRANGTYDYRYTDILFQSVYSFQFAYHFYKYLLD